MVDLFLELFKGLAPTIVAILAIVVNIALSRKREQTSQRISRVRLVNSGKIAVLNNLLHIQHVGLVIFFSVKMLRKE